MRITVSADVKLDKVRDAITIERDRRLALGFDFNGKRFDFDQASQIRILGTVQAAQEAKSGNVTDDALWYDGTTPFGWIAQDNSVMVMDITTCIEFGKAAAQHTTDHVRAAYALKTSSPIPSDYTDDQYWP